MAASDHTNPYDETQCPIKAWPYLLLIRQGVDLWNKWIKGEVSPDAIAQTLGLGTFPDPPLGSSNNVNFAGVDFTHPDNKKISFKVASFGDETNFSGASFGHNTDFSGASFGHHADFSGTSFGFLANFSGATFGHAADFSSASFGHSANFSGASFGYRADFSGASFGNHTDFSGASFGGSANFSGASFGGSADFSGASFGGIAGFSDTRFGRFAYFSDANFEGSVFFKGTDRDQQETRLTELAKQQIEEEGERETWIKAQLEDGYLNKLTSISFCRTRFGGKTDFKDRIFEDFANFSHAKFDQPPRFENCEGMERLDVTGAQFSFTGERPKYWPWMSEAKNQRGWTTDSNIPTQLRILRKQMEDIKAHDAERDLFIAERQAERGVLISESPDAPGTFGVLLLFYLYQKLSDCGRSARLPAVWLLWKSYAFFLGYLLLAQFGCIKWEKQKATLGDFVADIFSFTLGHALPFLSSLSKVQEDLLTKLFGSGPQGQIDMPLIMQFASTIQSLIGALLLFLFLQAIRNHFRLR